MEKDNCLVQVEGEDGKVFNMLILKEFDYKNKKYAVLTEVDKCHCGCKDECDCDDDCECGCNEGEECNCEHECHCHDNCDCDDDCECGCNEGKECTCEHECHCKDEEDVLCILEITKDKDGNEIFKSIDDEKLFNEIVEEADKVLYED